MMRVIMKKLFKKINLNLFFEFFILIQMTDNIETQPINEIESSPKEHKSYKYNNEEEKHEAIKSQKRNWYYANSDKQKLKSLRFSSSRFFR